MIIIGISRQRVRDERITNLEVRRRFLNMPTLTYLVKRRVLKYHKLESEKTVFKHANIDEPSEAEGPDSILER
jgi:hypothetical protein